MSDWICTDPDTHQYCKKITDHSWVFYELRHLLRDTPNGIDETPVVCYGAIDLYDYTLDEIWEVCSAYYDSFEDMVATYGFRSALQIMAECIFEQTESCELSVYRFITDEQAIQMIQRCVINKEKS